MKDGLLKNVLRPVAARILMGGAYLYGLAQADSDKAAAAAAAGKP